MTAMLEELSWRILEQRRADARLCLFYKIVYGLVAVPLPDYIQLLNSRSGYCHSLTFRQIHTSHDFYKYSFYPLAIVQSNGLPPNVVSLPTLDSFKEAVGRLQIQGLRSRGSCFYRPGSRGGQKGHMPPPPPPPPPPRSNR